MTPEAREKLREIQRRPKSAEWKRKMGERWRRRFAVSGRPARWTEDELKTIGTRPDREVAKLLNRSLSSVKGKKFQLLREARTQGQKTVEAIGSLPTDVPRSPDANSV